MRHSLAIAALAVLGACAQLQPGTPVGELFALCQAYDRAVVDATPTASRLSPDQKAAALAAALAGQTRCDKLGKPGAVEAADDRAVIREATRVLNAARPQPAPGA